MALRRIALRDFVIVQALDLDLDAGFTVLTGETGAGKSILIDALQMLLGARADTGVIREGAARTDICAEFDTGPAALAAWLHEAGFPHEDVLLLRRTVDLQGKSRAWINGIAATAAQMRALGEHLLDIHGQHAWQSLTRPDAVRGLLDAYAGAQVEPLAALWSAWRDARKALEHARSAQDTLQQERERLQWQIGEVDRLAPREGESRLRVLIALQGAQGGEGRHQSQRHQQGAGQALVEQQGSHQQEAGESDRAARVARPLALAEFEHEHAGRQGAARIATEQVAVLGDDGQGQGQGQRQAHPPGKPAPIRSQAALQPAHRQQGKHGQVQPDRQVGHVHGHGTGHRQSQQVEGMAVQARHSRASSRRQACRWWGPRSGPRRHDGRCRA